MSFDTGGQFFMRARKKDDNSFYLSVNRGLTPKKSAQYKLKVQVEDEFGAKSIVPSILIIDITYTDK